MLWPDTYSCPMCTIKLVLHACTNSRFLHFWVNVCFIKFVTYFAKALFLFEQSIHITSLELWLDNIIGACEYHIIRHSKLFVWHFFLFSISKKKRRKKKKNPDRSMISPMTLYCVCLFFFFCFFFFFRNMKNMFFFSFLLRNTCGKYGCKAWKIWMKMWMSILFGIY